MAAAAGWSPPPQLTPHAAACPTLPERFTGKRRAGFAFAFIFTRTSDAFAYRRKSKIYQTKLQLMRAC